MFTLLSLFLMGSPPAANCIVSGCLLCLNNTPFLKNCLGGLLARLIQVVALCVPDSLVQAFFAVAFLSRLV